MIQSLNLRVRIREAMADGITLKAIAKHGNVPYQTLSNYLSVKDRVVRKSTALGIEEGLKYFGY